MCLILPIPHTRLDPYLTPVSTCTSHQSQPIPHIVSTYISLQSLPIPHISLDPHLTSVSNHTSHQPQPVPHTSLHPYLTSVSTHTSHQSQPIPHIGLHHPCLISVSTHTSHQSQQKPVMDKDYIYICQHSNIPRYTSDCHPDTTSYLSTQMTDLQMVAMSRAAKSRRAQWLSESGRRHSCRLTTHVVTAGISACN